MADDQEDSLVLGGRHIGDLRVTDLKKELEERGLPKSGNKKELVQRLSESLLEKRGSPSEDGDGQQVQERGRKPKAGHGHSSSRSSSGSSSSGSESRSRSPSNDDKSSSSSGSESRSRSRSASSRSSSASDSPSPKKPSSSGKMEKRDNGTSRVEEMKESSAQRSPLKLKIRMDMASPERSHVETIVPQAVKEKKKEQKVVEKQVPEPSEPQADTTKDEKQAKVDGEDMDVGSPKKEEDVEVESPKRRISVEDSTGDKRITVDSSKEDQRIAVTSAKDDRRIVQEKEVDESNDSQPNSTTTDVLDVKETGEIEKKEDDDVKQEPRPPRKRRWGGRKVSPKRQISISSESLKGLIPDVKPILAADPPAEMEVVKEEAASDHEKEDGEADDDDDDDDDERKDMKIRRTVTQVVSNEDRREVLAEEDHLKVQEDMEIQDVEPKVKSPPQIIRKLSRSKPLVVADEPQKARRSPSPPKHPTSRVIHIRNLVRPFTLRQLKELLERTGKLTEGGFWIDKIKSHCLVMYETDLDASKTRQALHNTKWPLSNPKNLSVDFSTEAELENFQDADKPIKREVPNEAVVRDRERERRERERDMDQRNCREPPIERRPSGREWDRAKVQRSPSPRVKSRDRSRSREPTKRQPKENRGKERKERKEKKVQDEEPPAKLLDDLFRKTKATPSVYWLPLTEQQALEGERRRIQEALDRDKRRQELEERMHAERKKREMERLERRKREQMAEREREKERERPRRHSRSRSRDRRRR